MRPFFPFGRENFHVGATRRTDHFAYSGFDGLARCAVNGGAANRQSNPFAGHGAYAFAAGQHNLAAIIQRDTRKNQHAVGGIYIIAAVFTDSGNPLLAFNMRRFNVKTQRDARGRDNRHLMDNVLAQDHQRSDFAAAVAQEPVV